MLRDQIHLPVKHVFCEPESKIFSFSEFKIFYKFFFLKNYISNDELDKSSLPRLVRRSGRPQETVIRLHNRCSNSDKVVLHICLLIDITREKFNEFLFSKKITSFHNSLEFQKSSQIEFNAVWHVISAKLQFHFEILIKIQSARELLQKNAAFQTRNMKTLHFFIIPCW